MKTHYYEQVDSSDVSYRDEEDTSWVLCGKQIGNAQVTINPPDISCGSCEKIYESGQAAA